MNKEQLKPIDTNVTIKTTLVFYEEQNKGNDFWGSYDIVYEVFYNTKDGIIEIYEIEPFGDRTLVKMFWDKRKRGITLKEMLEDIEEMSNMPLKEFKKILED